MAQNQQAIPRYRAILKVLRRSGQHSSKDIHLTFINYNIVKAFRTMQKNTKSYKTRFHIFLNYV